MVFEALKDGHLDSMPNGSETSKRGFWGANERHQRASEKIYCSSIPRSSLQKRGIWDFGKIDVGILESWEL